MRVKTQLCAQCQCAGRPVASQERCKRHGRRFRFTTYKSAQRLVASAAVSVGACSPRMRSAQILCGALAGPLFVTAFAAIGAARRGYDWRRHPVSSLAIGREGWQQRANCTSRLPTPSTVKRDREGGAGLRPPGLRSGRDDDGMAGWAAARCSSCKARTTWLGPTSPSATWM